MRIINVSRKLTFIKNYDKIPQILEIYNLMSENPDIF